MTSPITLRMLKLRSGAGRAEVDRQVRLRLASTKIGAHKPLRAYGPSACRQSSLPRDRSAASSSGSKGRLRFAGERAAGNSRNSAQSPVPAAGSIGRHREPARSTVDPSCGRPGSGGTPAIRSSRTRIRDGRPPRGERWASEFFCHEVVQRGVVEHRVGQQALRLAVLVLKLLKPLALGHIHPAELSLPRVERRCADPVLAQTSASGSPASCSRSTGMICSSVTLDRFIVRSFP